MQLDFTMGTMEHQRFHTIFRGLKNELKRTSRFKEKEIERLLITYYKMSLASGRDARGVARSQFSAYYRVFLGVAELNWIDPLISYIESGSIKYISPEAYMKVVELWQYGTFQERKKFCFGVYDVYKRGYITREALRKSCEKMIYGQTLEDTEYLITEYVDFLMRKFDVDRDGKISFDDYSKTVDQTPNLLEFLGQLIPQLGKLYEILAE